MKQRNCSMDVFRMIAALLVVSCHVDILIEGPESGYLFFGRFAPRVGVAFFFAMSGYFYIQALMNKKDVFKKQFVSLVKVYGVWSLIYYLASFVVNVIIDGEDLGTFLIERVVFLVTRGSYSHFWFFPALIYSVVLATIFNKCFPKRGIQILSYLSLVLFVIGNLGSAYYELGVNIPVLNTIITEHRDGYEVFRGIFCMGLPYFMMGYFLNRMEKWIEETSKKKIVCLVAVVMLLYCLEIIVLSTVLEWYRYPEVFITLYPAALVIMIALLKYPKPEWQRYAGVCKRLSGYFYYVHPLLILVIGMVAGVCNVHLHSIILYIVVIAIMLVSGLLLLKWNKTIKWISYLL